MNLPQPIVNSIDNDLTFLLLFYYYFFLIILIILNFLILELYYLKKPTLPQ